MVTVLAITASAWGVAMAVSPVLQIRRMVQEQSSAGVSLAYMVVLFVGFLLWLAYGISIANVVLIIPNTVAAFVIVATMVVALRYRRAVP
ncbi:MAG TPA: SemiSWEET family transporter [Gaiellaceae bacterium]|nr:SemiSWEET family transporter [Gaiellaceae bacterium]